MDRAARGPQGPALIPEFDPSARVVYVPVRHHSPACARQVARLIRELGPEAVLIEGPRDATHLIPLLTHAKTRMPVAIYTTFVHRVEGVDSSPVRHAAYYPLCDYSPELVAIRTAAEVLMSVQLGGGTDIAGALGYCETLVISPTRTILVLVTDFFEGGPPDRLVVAVKRLREAGARVLGLAALDAGANPCYDRSMAERCAAVGAEVAALTPRRLAEWIPQVIS